MRPFSDDWPTRLAAHSVDTDGRAWVAADESGATGENLMDERQQIVTHATVRIDDEAATPILDQLRQRTGSTQAPEAKFSQFTKAASLRGLAECFGPGGELDGRVNIVAGDKTFIAVSKMIDLLLEERAHERGIDLYRDGTAKKIARRLFADGPRGLGQYWEPLIAGFASLARASQRKGKKEDVESFYRRLEHARWHCHRASVERILVELLETRPHAEYLVLSASSGVNAVSPIDPMAALLPLNISYWHEAVGPVRLLHDDLKLLTPEFVQALLGSLWNIHPDFRWMMKRTRVAEFAIGRSQDHPSIQLADLAASAGRVVVEQHVGTSSEAAAALRDVFKPLVRWGVLPDDSFWEE